MRDGGKPYAGDCGVHDAAKTIKRRRRPSPRASAPSRPRPSRSSRRHGRFSTYRRRRQRHGPLSDRDVITRIAPSNRSQGRNAASPSPDSWRRGLRSALTTLGGKPPTRTRRANDRSAQGPGCHERAEGVDAAAPAGRITKKEKVGVVVLAGAAVSGGNQTAVPIANQCAVA